MKTVAARNITFLFAVSLSFALSGNALAQQADREVRDYVPPPAIDPMAIQGVDPLGGLEIENLKRTQATLEADNERLRQEVDELRKRVSRIESALK